jgi:hypothetical protein
LQAVSPARIRSFAHLVFSEHPYFPWLAEIAVTVEVDEDGATVGATVAVGIPQELGADRGMSGRSWYCEGQDQVHIRGNDLEAADIHQDIVIFILKDVRFAVVVKVQYIDKARRRKGLKVWTLLVAQS